MPCIDGPKPERYTENELKHLDKALKELGKISKNIQKIAYKSLPDSMKLEYTWCSWRNNDSR